MAFEQHNAQPPSLKLSALQYAGWATPRLLKAKPTPCMLVFSSSYIDSHTLFISRLNPECTRIKEGKKKSGSGSAKKTKENKHTFGRRAAGGAPQGPNERDASDRYDQSPSFFPFLSFPSLQTEQGWHPNNMGGFRAAGGLKMSAEPASVWSTRFFFCFFYLVKDRSIIHDVLSQSLENMTNTAQDMMVKLVDHVVGF